MNKKIIRKVEKYGGTKVLKAEDMKAIYKMARG